MKKIFCFILALFSNFAFAKNLPLETHGTWLSESILPDDGGYGKHYRSWLILNEDSIDEIFTLGDHYTKTKFIIRSSSEDGKLELVDVEEPWVILKGSLNFVEDGLHFCRRASCINFLRTSADPHTEEPILTTPIIEITTVWCVEKDCASQKYLPLQNEQLFNLNTGVQVQGGAFEGPLELEKRYDLKLSLSSIAYRMTNQTHKLSAYSTVIYFMGSYKNQFTEKLAQSSLLYLKEGLLTELSAELNGHNITVSVFIKRL